MKITVDINVLVRFVTRDNEAQAQTAMQVLRDAETIVIPTACFCELVWVLSRVYGLRSNEIRDTVAAFSNTDKVVADRAAVEAGLAMLEAGGDFADGVIAHEGRWLGGETFVSFDAKAVALTTAAGHEARLLAT